VAVVAVAVAAAAMGPKGRTRRTVWMGVRSGRCSMFLSKEQLKDSLVLVMRSCRLVALHEGLQSAR